MYCPIKSKNDAINIVQSEIFAKLPLDKPQIGAAINK
tara:strand:- start:202 stop:312 length:111 start_codon:yes stop_codon:yes gene_type:complete